MLKNLLAQSVALTLVGLLCNSAAQAEDEVLFPNEMPARPSDLYPVGPDFPAGPDLDDFPGIPPVPGSMICTSIYQPSGLTFTATGRKWTASARALAACQDWQNSNDVDGLGTCSILECETLILEI